MTDVLTPTKGELPVFSSDFLASATPSELAGAGLHDGFAIRDAELPLLAPATHERHMQAACRALRLSGVMSTAVNVSEGVLDPHNMPSDSGEHVDGFVGTYYQGHTTVAGETSYSRFMLRCWQIGLDEHTYLRGLLQQGYGMTARQSMLASAGTTTDPVTLHLAGITSSREPIRTIRHDTKTPYESVVMRNGYDASTESPDHPVLWTHQVLSINDSGVPVQKQRRIWFSRINADERTAQLNGNVTPITARRSVGKALSRWVLGPR